jgi:hypothetical protein
MIGFDVYFPERSAVVMHRQDVPDQDTYRHDELMDLFRDYDGEFVQACRDAGSVVIGQSFKIADSQDSEYIRRNMVRTDRGQTVASLLAERGDSWARPDWPELSLDKYIAYEPPIPELAEACHSVAYAQTVTDIDGVVRKYPLVLIYDGRIYPSLALMMIIDYLDVPRDLVRINPGEAVYLPLPGDDGAEEIRIPIDDRGMMFINWAGDWWDPNFHHYPHILIKRFPEYEADDLAFKTVKSWLKEDGELADDMNQFVTRLQAEMANAEIDAQRYFMQYLILTTALQIEEEIRSGSPLDTSSWPAERIEFYRNLKGTLQRNHYIADMLIADNGISIEAVADSLLWINRHWNPRPQPDALQSALPYARTARQRFQYNAYRAVHTSPGGLRQRPDDVDYRASDGLSGAALPTGDRRSVRGRPGGRLPAGKFLSL